MSTHEKFTRSTNKIWDTNKICSEIHSNHFKILSNKRKKFKKKSTGNYMSKLKAIKIGTTLPVLNSKGRVNQPLTQRQGSLSNLWVRYDRRSYLTQRNSRLNHPLRKSPLLKTSQVMIQSPQLTELMRRMRKQSRLTSLSLSHKSEKKMMILLRSNSMNQKSKITLFLNRLSWNQNFKNLNKMMKN